MTPITPAIPPLMILGTMEKVWAGAAVVVGPSTTGAGTGGAVAAAVGAVVVVSVADVMATAVAAANWSQLLQEKINHKLVCW